MIACSSVRLLEEMYNAVDIIGFYLAASVIH